MSTFADVATRLRDSKFIIPITLAVLMGLVIGAFAFYEDYMSSLNGYRLLPTRKSGQEVVQVIAFLPQIGQIIFFYLFGSTAESLPGGRRQINPLYFSVAFCLLLFDLGTDMYFKASGLPWSVWVIAFVESITVFTIGSELLVTASLGLSVELVPEALRQLGQVAARLVNSDADESRSLR